MSRKFWFDSSKGDSFHLVFWGSPAVQTVGLFSCHFVFRFRKHTFAPESSLQTFKLTAHRMAYTPEVQDKIAAKVEKFGGLRRDYELVINHKMLDKDGVPSIIDIFTGDYPDRKSQWPQFKSEGYEKYNAEDFKPAGEPVGVKPAKPAGK